MNDLPKILVLSGPGGAGKTSVQTGLVRRYPDRFESVTKWTTRARRPGEHEGDEFHFVSRATFEEGITKNVLLEHNLFNSHYYGVPRQEIEAARDRGHHPILVVEQNGARAAQRAYPGQTLLVFLTAPLEVLRERYISRGQTPTEADERIQIAREQELPQQAWYDLVIENQDGELVQTIETIAKAIGS